MSKSLKNKVSAKKQSSKTRSTSKRPIKVVVPSMKTKKSSKNPRSSTKRRRYPLQDLQKAKLEVMEGNVTAYKASQIYEVPISTLYRVKDQNSVGNLGRKPVLPIEVENTFVSALKKLADWGFGFNFDGVKLLVREYLVRTKHPNPFTNNTPGSSWWRLFRKRHPDIVLRRTQKMPAKRAGALSNPTVDSFFKVVEDKYKEFSYQPTHVFNCDETGYSGDQGKSRIVCGKSNYKKLNTFLKNLIKIKIIITLLLLLAMKGSVILYIIVAVLLVHICLLSLFTGQKPYRINGDWMVLTMLYILAQILAGWSHLNLLTGSNKFF